MPFEVVYNQPEPDSNPVPMVLTISRKNGKTPAVVIAELRTEIATLKTDIEARNLGA